MNEALNLSWSRGQAANAERRYCRILGINLLINVVIGLVAIIAPLSLANLFDQPTPWPPVWLRLWGVALVFLAILYVSGWLRPTEHRIINLAGLVERVVTGLVLLLAGAGFLLLGLYFLAFGAALTWSYYRLFQAELATRP